MFWKTSKEVPAAPPAIKEPANTLTIVMKDGHTLAWTTTSTLTSMVPNAPWVDFYKWYFGRESDEYVMRYASGETMFKREDIKRFIVTIDTPKVG